LEQLKPLVNLQELYMKQTTIGNEAITMMAAFPKLKKLRLAQNQIDASGTAELAKLTGLEELDLSECAQIFDDAMPPLGELKQLKKLNLWRVNITDIGIEPLSELTQLQSLNLDNTQLTDEGMPSLTGLTELTFLHLGSTQITDAGLASLESLTKLKDLIMTRTAVTAEGADELKQSLPNAVIQLKYLGN
ncbi:MAG: hypothetical protein AAGI63_10295, partial [Planctomycetota bacterium]